MFEDGHIEREIGEGVGVAFRRLHHARFHPAVFHGVVAFADERVGPYFPDAGQFARREVDDPFAHDVVDLGRPDVRSHLARVVAHPDGAGRGGRDAVDRICTAQFDVVILRAGRREVIFLVELVKIGVGALRHQRGEILHYFHHPILIVSILLPFSDKVNRVWSIF